MDVAVSSRVVPWGLVMGPFDSGGVLWAPVLYMVYSWYIYIYRGPNEGPILGAHRKTLGT